MTRFIFAACAVLFAAMIAAPSFAADLPAPVYKAPAYRGPVYVGPGFSWTGLYAGINGGYGFGKSNWTDTTGATSGDFNIKGALIGGTLGYNLQTGFWVWGIEGDLDYSSIKGTDATGCCTTKNDWLGTVRGRVGYAAWGNWLPYITGGAAFGDIKGSSITGSETHTKIGWTAGAGVEYAFLGSWSAKLEYLYADLGKATCSTPTCVPNIDIKFKSNIVRVGLNYRFW
jgi:outer membrane immunogenic protein